MYNFAELLDGITEASGQGVSFREQWWSTYIRDIITTGRRWRWNGHETEGSG
jgi:hypothetical protein